jgi:ComF family protein
LNKTKDLFLAIFFPVFCVGCGQEMPPGENWLCFKCSSTILPVNMQTCPTCNKITLKGRYCLSCKKDKNLKGVICTAYYEEGPIREMIHNFKYNGVTALAETLSELMVIALAQNFKLQISNFKSNQNDQIFKNLNIKNSFKIENLKLIISFVPLHFRRKAMRGYNQSEILARLIGQKTGLKVLDLLKKAKSTTRQAELSGTKRRKNLENAFRVKKGIDIKNKKIIIVDDVMTTGSTLEECARVLKTAGAKEVWGLVIARG